MDGVLVNSMEFHYQAYREVLSEFGRDLPREEYLGSLIGLRNYVILQRLLGDLPQEEVERLMAAKEAAFRRRVAGNVQALPGAAELVRRARVAGLKQAIVSSTPCENIELVVDSLGLRSMFDTLVGEEDAQHASELMGFGLRHGGSLARSQNPSQSSEKAMARLVTHAPGRPGASSTARERD